MANWVEFKRNYDHYWKSGARTAYKKGMIISVKEEVLMAAGNAVKVVDRPENGRAFIPEHLQKRKAPAYRPFPPERRDDPPVGHTTPPSLKEDRDEPPTMEEGAIPPSLADPAKRKLKPPSFPDRGDD